MKRDKQEYAISEFILLTGEIECEGCGIKDKVTTLDVEGASIAFYDGGWRVQNELLLCKKCRRENWAK